MLERKRLLRQDLKSKAAYQAQLLNAEHTPEAAATIDREIKELAAQEHKLEAQIRAASLNYTVLLQPKPLSLKTIQQQAIDNDTLLLEYSLGETRSYLWAVTKTEINSYELPGQAHIEALVNQVRDSLIGPQSIKGETFEAREDRLNEAEKQYWEASSSLSKILLAPAIEHLDVKRLVLIVDGVLQYLPFSALPHPRTGNDGLTPLMLYYEMTSQPSASALVALRERIGSRQPGANLLAIFADPVFEKDDPRLTAGIRPLTVTAQAPRSEEVYRALRGVGTYRPRLSYERLLTRIVF